MESQTPIRVAIAVVKHEDRFLVGTRPDGVPLAGFAEFPGGKVRANETPPAAAARECREETGSEIEVIGEHLCTTHQYDHGLLEIHFFDCRLLDPRQPPAPPFQWIDARELASMKFPAANATLLDRLLRDARNLGNQESRIKG